MALLLELAQAPEQEFEFRSEYQDSVVFDSQQENEELLTLTVYYDKGQRTAADLRLENGEPEPITLEQASGLVPARALAQQRDAERYSLNQNDPSGEGKDESATVERVIFPVEENLNSEQIRDAYVPAERGQVSAFRLEEMRYEIVVGLAGAKPDDPIEAAAKRNYYQGQADLYNNIRTGLVRDDPSLEAALPWEIKTEAIQAPEIQEERDKTKERDQSQVVTIG